MASQHVEHSILHSLPSAQGAQEERSDVFLRGLWREQQSTLCSLFATSCRTQSDSGVRLATASSLKQCPARIYWGNCDRDVRDCGSGYAGLLAQLRQGCMHISMRSVHCLAKRLLLLMLVQLGRACSELSSQFAPNVLCAR
eukprot:GHUV01049117.1.p1 GENE.GHUV01049117.1~~GHUV01049117.1.p1  ORF type:complete len:141 (-),score=2.78 GHUV01049117.1:146-568(-)